MSYNKLLRLNTYHNENVCKVTIKGQDTKGNKMYNDIVLTYKLGDHVYFPVPEFIGYYVMEDKLDFCIRKDMEFVLVYHKFFLEGIHIDLHDMDNLTQLYHINRYTTLYSCPDVNDDRYLHGQYEYVFEDLHYSLQLPIIDGYFMPDQSNQLYSVIDGVLHFTAISDDLDFYIYKKFKSLTVHYVDELGIELYTTTPELTTENMLGQHFIYTPEILNDNYYYEPVFGKDYVDIPLTAEDNDYTIKLIKYRKIYVHYNIHTDSSYVESETIDVIETREYEGLTLKLKVDDTIIVPITREFDGYYTDIKNVSVKILNDEHIFIDFYKYLTFDLICMYEHSEIQRVTYTDKLWNTPFVVEPPTISGKKTDTAFVVFNGEEDKVIYVVYH